MFSTVARIVRKIKNKPEKDFEAMRFTGETAFNWKHLPDQRLYTDNDYAIDELEAGIALPASFIADSQPEEKVIYHCYWYGEMKRKQVFSIKSLLCTQDMNKCRVILWLDIHNGYHNHEQNPLLQAILPFIEVKAYDPLEEIKGTPWKGAQKMANQADNLAKRSDAFRFLVLYKYGGLYFDLDVMFLNDFGALRDVPFCYAWESQPFANSALLNFKRKSDFAAYTLQKSIQKQTVLPWVILHYADAALKELCVLPCAFFDPVWQGVSAEKFPISRFEQFFQPFDNAFANKYGIDSYKAFFPGCYAYHWHNQWATPEHENSFFGIFEKEFNQLLHLQ